MIDNFKDGFIATIAAIEVARLPFWEFQNIEQIAVLIAVVFFTVLVLIAWLEDKYKKYVNKRAEKTGKRKQQDKVYTIDVDEMKITDVRRFIV